MGTRRRFSREFKVEAVKLVLERGVTTQCQWRGRIGRREFQIDQNYRAFSARLAHELLRR